jgi:hypothetical protein
MPTPDDFVTPEARQAEYMDQAAQMSGAAPAPGMAPYPLYGIPPLGTEGEAAVPFYRRPVFCYGVGAVAGFGLGWAFFGWFKPKYMKKNVRKRRTTRKKAEPQES